MFARCGGSSEAGGSAYRLLCGFLCFARVESVEFVSQYTPAAAVSRFDMADPASSANFDEIIVSNLALKWLVDFDTKKIAGSAELTVKAKVDNVSQLVRLEFNDMINYILSFIVWKQYFDLAAIRFKQIIAFNICVNVIS